MSWGEPMAEPARDMRAPQPAHPSGITAAETLGEPQGGAALGAVFWNEVRQMTGGIRFRLSAVLLMAVMALAAVTAGARYRDEALAHASVVDEHARETAGLPIDLLAEVLQPAVKPPWRLSLVVDGGQTATPDL